MRIPLFAANWKMNKAVSETAEFVTQLSELLVAAPGKLGTDFEVLLCPQSTHLSTLSASIGTRPIEFGAQNCGTAKNGAFTGEISPVVLKELGCGWTLVGHSERRHIYLEDDALVLSRTRAALAEGLSVVLCVGEKLEERRADRTMQVVETQLSILKGMSAADIERIVVAYEPVWAIGTGENATPEQAEAVHASIRKWYASALGEKAADALRILYGGSVKPENAAQLLREADVDGFLVGGASLDPVVFSNVIKNGLESRAPGV
ncbi:MAG: triose-phosphate isomerase [Bdellovibrionota bacterium]